MIKIHELNNELFKVVAYKKVIDKLPNIITSWSDELESIAGKTIRNRIKNMISTNSDLQEVKTYLDHVNSYETTNNLTSHEVESEEESEEESSISEEESSNSEESLNTESEGYEEIEQEIKEESVKFINYLKNINVLECHVYDLDMKNSHVKSILNSIRNLRSDYIKLV
jgi:hypothetical protein